MDLDPTDIALLRILNGDKIGSFQSKEFQQNLVSLNETGTITLLPTTQYSSVHDANNCSNSETASSLCPQEDCFDISEDLVAIAQEDPECQNLEDRVSQIERRLAIVEQILKVESCLTKTGNE